MSTGSVFSKTIDSRDQSEPPQPPPLPTQASPLSLCATLTLCSLTYTARASSLQTFPLSLLLSLPVISHSNWRWSTRLVPASLAATLIMPILARMGKLPPPPPPPGTPAQSVSTNSKKKTPDGIFPLASPLSGFSYLYVPRNSHSKQTTLQYVDEKPYLLACNLYIRSPLSGHSLIAVPPPSPQNRSLVIILYRPKTLSRLLTLLPSSTLCIILSILPSFHPPFPFPHSVFPSQQSCHTLT